MDKYINIEIGLCRAIMETFGIWPKDRNLTVYVRYTVSMTVILGFCNIPQTVRLYKARGNFDELLDIITNCNLTIMIAVIKNIVFWTNDKALGWLIDVMVMDWKSVKTANERKIMQKNAKLSRLVTIFIVWSVESAVFSFFALNAYIRFKESKHFRQGKFNATQRYRPMYMNAVFPYDSQKTPYYEITWVLQFLSTLLSASTFAAIDGFFSSVVLHLCAQLKNLRGQLKNALIQATQHKKSSKPLNISEITKRHEFLMSFAETIEDIFNLQFLAQLLGSILIFCLTGYQIFKIITSDELFLLNLIFAIYYYLCFATSLLIYCIISTILSTESTKLRETAYHSAWYELPPADARLLILIMIRTRRPFEFTAGKFVALSLELYCSVVKTSGGYLSMLIAMKNRLADN